MPMFCCGFTFLSIWLSVFGEKKTFFFLVWLFACLVLSSLFINLCQFVYIHMVFHMDNNRCLNSAKSSAFGRLQSIQFPRNQSLTPVDRFSYLRTSLRCLSNISLRGKRFRTMDVLFYCVLAGSNWSESKPSNKAGGGGAAHRSHWYCSRG